VRLTTHQRITANNIPNARRIFTGLKGLGATVVVLVGLVIIFLCAWAIVVGIVTYPW
tara:strand:- start:8860 stop:9030 length:171 start_codon:yes stop_codon:yes gene_type:complete